MFHKFAKCFMHLKWCPASRVSPSEKRIRNLLSLRAKTYCSTNLLTQKVSQQLRSSMLSCMGLLGIHPLEPQYKVTVGNVAWTDFLNCHDSCDFNRLFLSSGHPTGLAVRPSDVALWHQSTWPNRSQCFLNQGWTNPFSFPYWIGSGAKFPDNTGFW